MVRATLFLFYASSFATFQEKKSDILHGVENIWRHPSLLHQLHNWRDPVAIYMDSWFSKSFNLLEFGIKVEYALQIRFMFQIINSSLISIYLQEAGTIDWMLSWLHCKYDYT